ncbi:MAG: hypothetical protein HQL31_04400, partial [Planctomycetes bacterium]|nr:hypothetical protein [Planctomycetota bacterium]
MTSGHLHELKLRSALLKANPLGNPCLRSYMVYTPPDYRPGEKLPCVLFLPGYGSGCEAWRQKDLPAHRLLDLLILT